MPREDIRTRDEYAEVTPDISPCLFTQVVPKGDLQLQYPLQLSFKLLYLREMNFDIIEKSFLGPLGLSFSCDFVAWAISMIVGAGRFLSYLLHLSSKGLRESSLSGPVA